MPDKDTRTEAQRELEYTMGERDEALKRGKAMCKALAFASSVIKSGDPWTEACESIIGTALRGEAPDHVEDDTPSFVRAVFSAPVSAMTASAWR